MDAIGDFLKSSDKAPRIIKTDKMLLPPVSGTETPDMSMFEEQPKQDDQNDPIGAFLMAPPMKGGGTPPPSGTGGEDSSLKRFAKGAFEGVGQAGLGALQFAADAVLPVTVGSEYTDPYIRQPLTDTVDASRARVNDLGTAGMFGQIAGNVAGSIPLSAAGATRAAPAVANAGSRILGATVLGATEGAKQAVGSNDSRLANTLIGGGTGGAFQGGAEGVKQVGKAIVPEIGEAAATLAKRAQELGVPVTVQQVAPSRIRNTVQKVSQAVPLSGVKKFEENQVSSWNKAIAKTLGEESDNVGPETIRNFLDKSSTGFNEVLKGKSVQVDPLNVETLDTLVDNAKGALSDNLVKVIQKNVDDLKANIGGDSVIPGEKLASFRSELLKRIGRAEAGAKEYLGEVVDVVDDLLDTSLDDASKQALGQLRRQWRNYRTIEPLLEKSTNGEINPTMLLNRVAASPYIKASRLKTGTDELVDLARIGKEFLPKLGGSDTFEKTGLTAGGVAGAMNPVLGAKILGGVALNRAFQKFYNQSPAIVNKAIENALGKSSGEAVKLLQKGAPLDVVAKAISNSGAGKEEVKKAMDVITRHASKLNNELPTGSTIKTQINVRKTGESK